MKTVDDVVSFRVDDIEGPLVPYNEQLDKQISELSSQLADAQILANNVLSPQSILGCGQFEGCSACPNQKYCLRFMAKKYLERYGQ